MKIYEQPEIMIEIFSAEDVITTSVSEPTKDYWESPEV